VYGERALPRFGTRTSLIGLHPVWMTPA